MADTSFALNPLAQEQQQPSIMQQMAGYGQMAQQKIAIDQAKFNLANDHYTKLQQTLGGMSSDPAFDPKVVAANPQGAVDHGVGQIQNMLKMGVLDAPGAAQAITQLPTVEQLTQDPGAYKAHLVSNLNQAASNQEQFNRTYGVNTALNTGGNVLLGNTSLQTGQPTFTTSVKNSLTPEGKMGTQETVQPNGATVAIPKVGPDSPYDTYGNLRPGFFKSPDGTVSNSKGEAVGTDGKPTTVAAASGPQGFAMSLPPGEAGATAALAEASGKQLAADRINAGTYYSRVQPLKAAIPLMEKIGAGGQGIVGQYKAELANLAQSLGLISTNDAGKDFAEIKKYVVQNAVRNGDTGTNDKLAATFSGNPSIDHNTAAGVDLSKSAVAMMRMEQAKQASYGQDQPASGYSKHASDFQTNQDPRAYGFDMLTVPQRQEVVKSLGPKDGAKYKKFVTSLQNAHNFTDMGSSAPAPQPIQPVAAPVQAAPQPMPQPQAPAMPTNALTAARAPQAAPSSNPFGSLR